MDGVLKLPSVLGDVFKKIYKQWDVKKYKFLLLYSFLHSIGLLFVYDKLFEDYKCYESGQADKPSSSPVRDYCLIHMGYGFLKKVNETLYIYEYIQLILSIASVEALLNNKTRQLVGFIVVKFGLLLRYFFVFLTLKRCVREFGVLATLQNFFDLPMENCLWIYPYRIECKLAVDSVFYARGSQYICVNGQYDYANVCLYVGLISNILIFVFLLYTLAMHICHWLVVKWKRGRVEAKSRQNQCDSIV